MRYQQLLRFVLRMSTLCCSAALLKERLFDQSGAYRLDVLHCVKRFSALCLCCHLLVTLQYALLPSST
jgi:hypothetical protein